MQMLKRILRTDRPLFLKPFEFFRRNGVNLLLFQTTCSIFCSGFRSTGGAKFTMTNPLDTVEDVNIDNSGTFKYILIKVWPKDDESNFKYIVRGHAWAGFHADIFDNVEPKLLRQAISSDCVGGGRIKHRPDEATILVYGYSQGFGQADHSITVQKLKARYPNYKSITFENEGY